MNRTIFSCFIILLQLAVSLKVNAENLVVNKGTITIYVGEEKTMYHSIPYQYYVQASNWFLRGTSGSAWSDSQEECGVKIIERSSSSCTIKGMWDNEDNAGYYWCELHCKGTKNSTGEYYECYWKVIVKSRGTVTVSASPSGGTVAAGTKVYLTSSESGSEIYYSTNGSIPNKDYSTKYTSSGITINETTTLKAIAYKSGYESKVGTWEYTVPAPVTGLTLNKHLLNLKPNDTYTLRATITPSNANDKTVTWKSTDTNIADVSTSGVVTGKNIGVTKIICQSNNNSSIKDTCDVFVSSVNPWSTFTAKTAEGIEMKFYSRNDGTCYVYGTSSSPAIDVNTSGPITIPSEAEGLKVTSINSYSFYNCTGITNVTIPSTVESIGYYAFHGCSSLETVALGNGLKRLESGVFYNCTSLNSITGISQLEYIGGSVFYNTPWYNNLPDGLVYLGKVLHSYKGTMPDNTKVKVNDGMKMIASSAFRDCKGLVGISIPQSIETIGNYIFQGCTNLTSITVASDNEKYDSRNSCNAIVDKEKNILIAGCKGTTIPNTVTAIGNLAFYGSGIEELIIPNNVDSIASSALANCTSLKTLTIGKGLRVIDPSAIEYCSSLQSINVVSGNPYFDSRDNCNAIIERSTDKLIVGCTTTVIPQSVKTIGEQAFRQTVYGYSITIPDQVEKIEGFAFAYNANPRMLTIGKGVKEIGKNAFVGCNALRSIHVMSREPVEIDESVFKASYTYYPDTVYNNAILYVPTGSRTNYMTTPCWNKFKHIVETDGLTPCENDIIEPANSPLVFVVTSTTGKTCEVFGVKSTASGRISIPTQAEGCSVDGIGYDAFYNKKGITHIDIPTSVTYLDDYALYNCSDIESVELPTSLQRIGYFALGDLAKVTRIIIPKSVTDIGRGIFAADSMLTSVTVESGNPVYDSRGGCNAIMETATNRLVAGIQTSIIPQGTKTIGYFAFNSQKKLKSVTIPQGVTCIDEYAFNNCGLQSVTIPASVDSIGQRAFRYCRDLSEVTSLIENPTAINENVFHTDYINSEYQFTSATLYVPIGCKGKYQAAEGWNKFKNIVERESTPDPQPTLKGDVNEDEKVNGTDLVALTNIILGKSPEKVSADVNGDTKVNGTDYVALANIILGKTASRRVTRAAGAKGLSIEEFNISAGETKEMVIDLTNPEDEITLVQFDLRLPAGLSLKQTGGEYDFDIAGRTTWRKHSLDANAQADGSIRFLLASSSNAVLSGTEGAIITMTLVADNSFAGGDIKLENILMVTPDEKEKTQDTYVYPVGSPQPQPEPSSADLAIEPFDISAGETKEMVIDLTNPEDEITLVQFDLRLPAGLSLKHTGGEYDFDIAGRTTWRKHSLDANAQADGSIRFLLASSSNAVLSGTEGAIITMMLVADNSYSNDAIRLENILLVTPDEKEIKPADVVFTPTGIYGITIDSPSGAPVYTLSGQRLVAPKKGVNIIGGKKVIVK